jgi:hypothetical protein
MAERIKAMVVDDGHITEGEFKGYLKEAEVLGVQKWVWKICCLKNFLVLLFT